MKCQKEPIYMMSGSKVGSNACLQASNDNKFVLSAACWPDPPDTVNKIGRIVNKYLQFLRKTMQK